MKILLTSHKFWPDVGGIEVHSKILADCFYRSDQHVIVVTDSIEEASADQPESVPPYKVVRKPGPLSLLRLFLWSDVVFQNNIEIKVLWPLIFIRKPFVVAVHVWIRDAKGRIRLVDRLKRYILPFASRVISVSQAIQQDSYPPSLVIGNPYRSDLFQLIPHIPRTIALCFLGRLVSDKGVDLLINAFSTLRRDESLRSHLRSTATEFRLTIIGDGPEKDSLIDLSHSLQVSDIVDFAGVLHDLRLVEALNNHHVLAVPSRWPEPFGNVALEGMACGCLVVASDSGGLPDAVGSSGVLFRRGDVTDLTDKLRSTLLLTEDLVQKNREIAITHLRSHTAENVSNQYLSVLQEAAYHKSH